MLNTDRSRPPKSCNDAVQQANKGSVASPRDPININNGDMHYEVLEIHQRKYDKGKDTQRNPSVFIAAATVAVQ